MLIYKPSPTIQRFHNAKDSTTGFVRLLIGGLGNGKSVGCAMDTLMTAMNQQPDSNGIRRSRHVIVRNTYRELVDTTMKTFFAWIAKDSGEFSVKNMSFTLQQQLSDGTMMDAEFLFRALDKPDDVRKVLSLEITTAWLNEMREIPKAIFEAIQGRCGRYPSPMYGVSPTFHGVIGDTNPPDSDHWIYYLFEEHYDDNGFYTPPKNHKIFHMPSGRSPNAENTHNLPPHYYENLMAGKTEEWIKVYVDGEYGFTSDGKAVFPEYNDTLHHTDKHYQPNPGLPLYIGIDFGLTPAAVFGQLSPMGTLILFDELVTFDMGAVSFGKMLHQKLTQFPYRDFPPHLIEIYADPAGEQRSQVDETTPFLALQAQGINAVPTHTNDFTIRRESLASFMTTLNMTSTPALQITPNAPTVRKALAGGYKYKRLIVTGHDRFHDKPDKNKYSHTADAAMYLTLGAVGDTRVFGNVYSDKKLDYSRTLKGIR